MNSVPSKTHETLEFLTAVVCPRPRLIPARLWDSGRVHWTSAPQRRIYRTSTELRRRNWTRGQFRGRDVDRFRQKPRRSRQSRGITAIGGIHGTNSQPHGKCEKPNGKVTTHTHRTSSIRKRMKNEQTISRLVWSAETKGMANSTTPDKYEILRRANRPHVHDLVDP